MNDRSKPLVAFLLLFGASVSYPFEQGCLALVQPAAAQSDHTPRIRSLKGKHGLQVNLGVLGQASTTNQVNFFGTITESSADNFSGSVAYTYWFERDWAIHASIGFLDADAKTTVGRGRTVSEAAAVMPLLLGLRYYPSALAPSSGMRPFLAGALGSYVGWQSADRFGPGLTTEARSETAAGAYVGAGIDWFVSNLFKIGLNGGYHFVSDFDRPIGTEDNYSGAELSLTFGFIFGKSRP